MMTRGEIVALAWIANISALGDPQLAGVIDDCLEHGRDLAERLGEDFYRVRENDNAGPYSTNNRGGSALLFHPRRFIVAEKALKRWGWINTAKRVRSDYQSLYKMAFHDLKVNVWKMRKATLIDHYRARAPEPEEQSPVTQLSIVQ
jgi:hypothetical protein